LNIFHYYYILYILNGGESVHKIDWRVYITLTLELGNPANVIGSTSSTKIYKYHYIIPSFDLIRIQTNNLISILPIKKRKMAPVPLSILRALSLPLDPSKISLSGSGFGSGFSKTGRIHARVPNKDDGSEEERQYFIKTSPDGKEMFQGEFASLNAIADTVPGFCPRALAWGALDEEEDGGGGQGYFLVTEFLDLGRGFSRSSRNTDKTKESSLAYRLGKLHSTPAPPPPESSENSNPKDGNRKPQFGFPVPTYCGDSRQQNHFCPSWADFYALGRLRTILKEGEDRQGKDKQLRDLVVQTADVVVPRLLGDDHLGYNKKTGQGNGIVPVVVHGDLWSGNASQGRIVGSGNPKDEEGAVGDVVYDPSACYAHSEYELGIMHMFGGFNRAFFDEYHLIVPKTEPVEEYEDRAKLYEL
jgi:protein-ribulosamine 3-kinase